MAGHQRASASTTVTNKIATQTIALFFENAVLLLLLNAEIAMLGSIPSS